MSMNTILKVYRDIGGRRIPYRIEIDAEQNVVYDKPDLDVLHNQAIAAAQSRVIPLQESIAREGERAREARKLQAKEAVKIAVETGKIIKSTEPLVAEQLETAPAPPTPPALPAESSIGTFTEEVGPDGKSRRVYHPTKADITVGAWVTKAVETNPLEGTDELRAEYFQALEAMEAKHAADGTICKPCDKGALMRKYRTKLEKLGLLT